MSPPLAYALPEAALAELEARLGACSADREPLVFMEAALSLAWHLRQRDPARAERLCVEAQALLVAARELPVRQRVLLQTRRQLVQADALFRRADNAATGALCEQLLLQCERARDPVGEADTRLQRAALALRLGRYEAVQADLAWVQSVMPVIDPLRAELAQYMQAQADLLRAHVLATELWAGRLQATGGPQDLASQAWRTYCIGLMQAFAGDFGASARHFIEASLAAQESGQLNLAARSACNASASFKYLHAAEASLEWAQRSLDQARRLGAYDLRAQALVQCAEALRRLGRQSTARGMNAEAIETLRGNPAPREEVMTWKQLAALQLDAGRAQEALAILKRCEQSCRQIESDFLLAEVWLEQGLALLALGDTAAGLALTQRLLELPDARHVRAACLGLRAKLLVRQAEVADASPTALQQAEQALQQALALSEGERGVVADVDLLEALALVSERQGDLARACQYSLQLGQALDAQQRAQAASRATALEVAEQTSRTRDEREQAQRLAQQAQERAQALEQLNGTLARLGEAGREIAAQLEQRPLSEVLQHWLQQLLQVDSFAIYAFSEASRSLSLLDSSGLPPGCGSQVLALDEPGHGVARCARERQEWLAEAGAADALAPQGRLEQGRAMCAPLLVGDRLMGVLYVQAHLPQVGAEQALVLLRSFSAYVAIARANIEARAALAQAQAQLAEQERLAALGQLVANVAHEINTPMAVVKTCAEGLSDGLLQVLRQLPGLLRRLSQPERLRLFELVDQAREAAPPLSSRDERQQLRALVQQLEAAGLNASRPHAELLLRLQAQSRWAELFDWLCEPHALSVLQMADSLVALLRATAHVGTAHRRMARMAFALERFAPPQSRDDWVTLDLRSSLEEALQAHRHLLRHGIELVLDLQAGLIVSAQPHELQQVWSNLIVNAVQAMAHQGRLSLSCTGDEQGLQVTVSDTGCGIDAALLPRIFEPFFSTKPRGEGSGIGLDIVRKIVRRHGGAIEVSSRPGQGASFLVRLPLAPWGLTP